MDTFFKICDRTTILLCASLALLGVIGTAKLAVEGIMKLVDKPEVGIPVAEKGAELISVQNQFEDQSKHKEDLVR